MVGERKVYLMVNKPRGLVTTRDDPQGRGTVYDCLDGLDLPFVSPVGRLDKASEGLLLMTNDTQWASRLLDPVSGVDKLYHVQIGAVPDEAMLRTAPRRSGGRRRAAESTIDRRSPLGRTQFMARGGSRRRPQPPHPPPARSP